eukprot:TRINITY_DN30972_c0_g1_i1.p1 TRINITY_DN30972_c0_g1~~TRINITY_DN30972_c0_g1_i1.p1  ORF type:complete len:419 (+),score=118.41 TRINITY_DN30972_c0_g1_i1:37-1293(+)
MSADDADRRDVSPSPSSYIGLTPRYTIQPEQAECYKHERVVEVEQKDEGVQVNSCEDDTQAVEYLVRHVASILGSVERRVLWEIFCTCDSKFSGVLDRFDLTLFLKQLDPTSTARDISRWVQELDGAAEGLAEGGVAFVELLDWWERAMKQEYSKTDRGIHQTRSALVARGNMQRVASMFTWPFMKAALEALSVGQLSRAVEGLQLTSLQVGGWIQEQKVRESEMLEKTSFLAARALGKYAGLAEGNYEKHSYLFKQFAKQNTVAEVEETIPEVEEPAPQDDTSEVEGMSLETMKADMKQCTQQLSGARKSYNEALLGDGSPEEINNLQELIKDLEERERHLQTSVLRAKGLSPSRHKATEARQLTIDVLSDLTKLCNLAGIHLTHYEASIIQSIGIYKSKMDVHSFLCFVAVRKGKV